MVCIYGRTVHSTGMVLVGTVVEVAVVVAVVMVEDTNSNHTTHNSMIIHICHLHQFKGVSVYHLDRWHQLWLDQSLIIIVVVNPSVERPI